MSPTERIDRAEEFCDELPHLPLGTILNRRYRLARVLGQGGMGTVYAREQLDLGSRLVAMKILHPQVAHDPIAVERFRDETTALYMIRNRNVLEAYEFFATDGVFAFTMEYVEGGDLRDILDRDKVPTGIKSVQLMYDIYNGVAAIHEIGIVHRDLKPENILMAADGIPKVADFGIACWTKRKPLPYNGEIFGTLDYLSPEYLQSGVFDHRSDIFALGIISFEILGGRLPRRGENLRAALKEKLNVIEEFDQSVVEVIIKVVERALAYAPEERFQSVEMMKSWIGMLLPAIVEEEPVVELIPNIGSLLKGRRIALR